MNACHECGKPATIFDIDPYADELFPEADNPEVWWCDDCIQSAMDDI